MIDSNNKEEEVYSHNDLYIAFGVTFLGTINVPGTAQINGSVTGELTSNILNIGPQGYFKGKVRATEIDVSGTLMDNIECEGLLKIRKTGKVSGQLFYADLDIERGGQFEGQMVNSSK
jgi:cytoskeletal protein CcmA (bactofilin family)